MRILIIAPELSNLARGNHVTALRWGRILDRLGHEVTFAGDFHGQDAEMLIALHAIRSAPGIAAFHTACPDGPIVVALTGTDIYGLDEQADIDIDHRDAGWRSMDLAARVVVLQPLAAEEVPELVRDKVVVIFQSAQAPPSIRSPSPPADGTTGDTPAGAGAADAADVSDPRHFDVCVVGELRAVKDPFRTALAARRLPSASRLRVRHVGPASSQEIAERAVKEEQSNARYTWLGELARHETMALIASSRLVVVSSRHEGGPNVLSEALAAGVPALATCIPGNEGILGEEYPGYFPVEDTEALAELLHRAETDIAFYRRLCNHVGERAALVDPERELRAWQALIAELDTGRRHETETVEP